MTIRRTLIGLFLMLGIALCSLVAFNAATSVSRYLDAQELARSNLAREQLARLTAAIAQERTETYLALLGATDAVGRIAERREETDQAFHEASATLGPVSDTDSSTLLEAYQEDLEALRRGTEEEQASSGRETGETAAADFLAGYSRIVDELISLRAALLAQEHPADPATAAAFQMRRYAGVLLENLALNQALLGGMLIEVSPVARQRALDQLRRNADRAELAYSLLEDQSAIIDRPVRLELASLAVAYAERYRPMERDLLASPGEDIRSDAYPILWNAREITRLGAGLQEQLFTYSRYRLEQQQLRASLLAMLWVTIFIAGVLAVAGGIFVVLSRVIQPLSHLRGSMLALAEGDLNTPLPEHPRHDEIGVMADTLRVFKANATRRERLQVERLALHEKLQGAYKQLESDLQAAAAVQLALLPAPARIGGVAFSGQLRPSHYISGDSYDVLCKPNGSVHFFLVDVAGHGAAAALVSVASHYTMTEAILKRTAGENLAEVVAGLNADWPEQLPYFTMVLGELRPETGQGVLVQAGHPPPLLLRSTGQVEPLGTGGLPVGVIARASFEETRFTFEPGDRLLVYSDGVTEAENAAREPFSEERLAGLVQQHSQAATEELLSLVLGKLQAWRAPADPDDDMTLLILEAYNEEARPSAFW